VPFAKPVQHIGKETVFEITVKVFGDHPAPFALVEDDGETFDFERGAINRLSLSWADGQGKVDKSGDYKGPSRYAITAWEKVPLSPPNSGSILGTSARSQPRPEVAVYLARKTF